MGRVVAQARDSIESPVFAPREARMFPFARLSSLITPSVPPTATTVEVGLIAREVNTPASNRASTINQVLCRGIPSLVILHTTAPV